MPNTDTSKPTARVLQFPRPVPVTPAPDLPPPAFPIFESADAMVDVLSHDTERGAVLIDARVPIRAYESLLILLRLGAWIEVDDKGRITHHYP